MSLKLHSHPLSSYCQKVLVALYESGTPFEPRMVDFGNAESSAAFKALWPVGKMPVLRDEARGRTIPESTVIIEYLNCHYRGSIALIPADADRAIEVRLWDRFYDLHVQDPMQRIVGDRLRPADAKDPHGVSHAQRQLRVACDVAEGEMARKTWAAGDSFSMADCAAAPALFYANEVLPFRATHPNLTRYFDRLLARPSFARVVAEAQPYFKFFPR